MRNATGIDYSQARRLGLAYHGTQDGALALELAQPDVLSCDEWVDYSSLQDHLTVYAEQHARDAELMTAYERLTHCFR